MLLDWSIKSLARNSVYPYLGVEWFRDVGVVLFCKAIYIASQHINKEQLEYYTAICYLEVWFFLELKPYIPSWSGLLQQRITIAPCSRRGGNRGQGGRINLRPI